MLVHGRHGNEDVPWIFARNIPGHWLIVSPRAIEFEPETDEHETGYSWIEMPEDGWPDIDSFDGAVQALSDFVSALPDTYGADPERIIVLGFSQGAATALATAVDFPNLFKGIASLVGFIPSLDEDVLQHLPLQGMPLFFASGDRDDRIPVEISEASVETLRGTGANLEATMYSVGHKLNVQGMRDLSAWFEQRFEELEENRG